MKQKILVIGPDSLTGSRFIELGQDFFEFYGAGQKSGGTITSLQDFQPLDLTDSNDVDKVISKFPGDLIVNFAGATIVDEVEKTRPANLEDEELLSQNVAYKVNVLGTRYLAEASKRANKFPIFISTGMVFDGESGPYSEEDPVASDFEKLSWYAWTKILAEKEVEDHNPNSLIIRISYPYRSNFEAKTDFARTFLKLFDEYQAGQRSEIYPIFADQTLTPTFIDDLAPAFNFLVAQKATGIFHLTSPELTTPYDFCLELLREVRGVEDPSKIIKKGSIVQFQKAHPEKAKRPVKGGEKVDKLTGLGFTPTDWHQGIKQAFNLP